MSYTPNIPVSGESLGGTRDRIRGNFQVINTFTAENHVAFGLAGEGKHKFLQMPEQGSAPTTAADEAGLYVKQGSAPAEASLFFRGEANGKEYQLSKPIQAEQATFGTTAAYGSPTDGYTQTGGWTFLPGNLIMAYGFYGKVGSTDGSRTVAFPLTFPTACFCINITNIRSSGSTPYIVVRSFNGTEFIYNRQGTDQPNDGIFWTAIGY